ncbi:MAG: hypothetical protein SGCHY_000847 [Lobulomycetales sp.]
MISSDVGLALLIVAIVSLVIVLANKRQRGLKIEIPLPSRELSDEWTGNPSVSIKEGEIPCSDPATGFFIASVPASSAQDVADAVKRAKQAQRIYAKDTGFSKRAQILQSLYDYILENKDDLCRISARDTGKTKLDATFAEIIPTLEKIMWTIQYGPGALAPESRESGRISMLTSARVEYHPVGVMGVIVSWNYPIHNVLSPLVSALMAGNGCVIKCSEQTAWTSVFLSSLIRRVLTAHHVSPDLVSFVNGYGEAGEALVRSADKITFIGSPRVGQLVMRTASETLTPVVLELGGKDAAIVFNDCEFDQMFGVVMRASLQNAGQNCAGLERICLQNDVYEAFIEKAGNVYRDLRVGSPFENSGKGSAIDVGAITMAAQVDIISELVDDAVAKGASVVAGGSVYHHPKYPKGQYYLPTILADITPEMRIYHEEVFGPVLLAFKFSSEKEALAIANATPFGLGAAVFSCDYGKAERVSRQVRAGMCNAGASTTFANLSHLEALECLVLTGLVELRD